MSKRKKNINRTKYGDYSSGTLNPNGVGIHIFLYSIISFFILLYSAISIFHGKMWIPKRHGGLYVDGIAMYTMITSLIMMVIRFYLPVMEYYVSKSQFHNRNRIRKRIFKMKKRSVTIAWTLFILSIIIGVLNNNLSKA